MKQIDIIKVLAKDLGTQDVTELNKLLKAKDYQEVKYRITGKSLGHFGYTGVIKNISAEGLKVYNVNKVSLIRFSEMESFEKAKPRVERPRSAKVEPKLKPKPAAAKPPKKKATTKDREDDGFGEFVSKKPPQGSRFIPKVRK